MDTADNPPDIHLTGSQAGAVATTAGAHRLLLTHIPPWHDPGQVLAEARTTYAGDVVLAESGTTYVV
ncbi:MAG: beta-lactamase domain protein [Nocardioidaceae bacterium]|nr:beta-lactamase domain protein [Nocardioidaceae bacterium]